MDPSVFSSPTQTNSLSATGSMGQAPSVLAPQYDEKKLLDKFDALKRESMEYRWIWEREWLRDIFYVLNRQWITFHPTRREWVDKRLQKWIPRPVTNKTAEAVQAIRANLAAINLAVTARPVGHDTQSIAAAEIADQMGPLIHEEHIMDYVMKEADFWFIVTGNACLQTSWDKDVRFNKVFIPHEQCVQCGQVLPPEAIVRAGHRCPNCGGPNFVPSMAPDGKPQGQMVAAGRGQTVALSPFEYAFPPNVTRFDDLPYIIRLRWRDKHYFEANHPDMVGKIVWEKSPSDRSLQIFKSLALTNDVGTGSQFAYLGAAGAHTVEGVTEYEIWMKPTQEFPGGFVMRVIGDKSPVLMQAPEEGIPGPIPYKDIEGNPIFPFCHAQYEQVGGRLLGRSAISPIIQKQDQLNQLDSLIQLIVQRMANPVWVVPENAGIEHFTGEPGLIMKWNVLAAGGQGKPERIPGQEVPSSLYQLRAQILDDIEALAGTYDILKGQKPAGVEAFSALQLLVERSQSRFTSAYQARGEMYRAWFSQAIELERQFGPQQRTYAVIGPNRGYTFKHFENAQLQGQVTIQVEDGSTMPKTALGKRAAIEQANQLQLLDPHDPDQKYALLTQFGLADLVPTLNFHVQAALQIQDAFEQWMNNPQGPSPLVIKTWFDPHVHWTERIKWLNTDHMREMLTAKPLMEPVIDAHLQQLQAMMNPPPPPPEQPKVSYSFKGPDLIDPQVRAILDKAEQLPPPQPPMGGGLPAQAPPKPFMAPGAMGQKPKPQGGALAMHSSNQQSGAISSLPHGNNPIGPQVGPH